MADSNVNGNVSKEIMDSIEALFKKNVK